MAWHIGDAAQKRCGGVDPQYVETAGQRKTRFLLVMLQADRKVGNEKMEMSVDDEEWRRGMKDGIPICLGYFAVAFAFGIQAEAVGLTAFQASLMSVTNLTSAGQFAALGMISAGGSYAEMALAQLVVNLRYCLMSCALSQKIKEDGAAAHRFGVAYGVTDEIFGISVCRPGELNPFYSYGLMTVAIPGWTLGTTAGVVSGNLLPQSVISALGIAIYGMFLAVIIPAAKGERSVLGVVVCAMLVSVMFRVIPALGAISSGFQVILITVIVSAAAAVLMPVGEEGGEPGETAAEKEAGNLAE
ncbi:AzlC family ABC transporter permease [Bacilliculturomica massiliensis]|uniref:AzlC family ABC transporter permease n=1 Tax=Bacilliculturomica massiliensis TaxID=1917867 RepID=UPI002ED618F8